MPYYTMPYHTSCNCCVPARDVMLTYLPTGPFTTEVSEVLKIKNPNPHPVAFKVRYNAFLMMTRLQIP